MGPFMVALSGSSSLPKKWNPAALDRAFGADSLKIMPLAWKRIVASGWVAA